MSKAKVMLTFDDGLLCHWNAAVRLVARDLRGVFGIVTDRVSTPGYLAQNLLKGIEAAHCICNHTAKHLRFGTDPVRPYLKAATREEITEDILAGKRWLEENDLATNADVLLVPFGTANLDGPDHVIELRNKGVKFFRMTVGWPTDDEAGWGWRQDDFARLLFDSDRKVDTIGITEPADVRRPDGVTKAVDAAVAQGKLAVILYHDINHVVGESQAVTYDRFISDIDYIAKLVAEGKLECVLPRDIIREAAVET